MHSNSNEPEYQGNQFTWFLPRVLYGSHQDVAMHWYQLLTCFVGDRQSDDPFRLLDYAWRPDNMGACLIYRPAHLDSCESDHTLLWRPYIITSGIHWLWQGRMAEQADQIIKYLTMGAHYSWFMLGLLIPGIIGFDLLNDRSLILQIAPCLLRSFDHYANSFEPLLDRLYCEPGFQRVAPADSCFFLFQLLLCCGWKQDYITVIQTLSGSYAANVARFKAALNQLLPCIADAHIRTLLMLEGND